MATAARTVKRTTKGRRTSAATTAKRRATTARKSNSPSRLVNILVPLVFIGAILTCFAFLLSVGYRTVTASSFFDAKSIAVAGNSRVSKDEIEKMVRSETERRGTWNADLEKIKGDLEKSAYIKTAIVSRVLPGGIEVKISERVPRAIVRRADGDFWVDDEAVVLGAVGKNEARQPFVLTGWDEARSEKAQKDNQERVRLFTKIREDWQTAGIAKRVSNLDLADMQDLQATITDAGANIPIALGKDDLTRRLQKGLEVVESNKGKSIESLISHGSNVIAKYRNN